MHATLNPNTFPESQKPSKPIQVVLTRIISIISTNNACSINRTHLIAHIVACELRMAILHHFGTSATATGVQGGGGIEKNPLASNRRLDYLLRCLRRRISNIPIANAIMTLTNDTGNSGTTIIELGADVIVEAA